MGNIGKAITLGNIIILIIILLFPALANISPLDSSFCTYSNAPEASEWNVSELIPNNILSEDWSALNYASNWTTSSALSGYWIGNYTLVHYNANSSTGFSAIFVNQSKYNRSQSLVWTKVTNVSENSSYVFTGVVYAYYNYTNFSMVLFGDNEIFILDYVGSGGQYSLRNTLDHGYGDHGGQVIISTDAINYWTENGVKITEPYGAWIKTIYNTYCGSLKSKYWSGYPTLMQEPSGWHVEQESVNMSTDDSVCFGVAFWNPVDYACSNYSVHYDYINNWRLNYSLNYSATIYRDDIGFSEPRPRMTFPVVNTDIYGGDIYDIIMPDFNSNMTNATITNISMNITNHMSMESRPYNISSDNAYDQNDTVYYYSCVLTNFTGWYIIHRYPFIDGAKIGGPPIFLPPEPDNSSFSNNYLFIYVMDCTDGRYSGDGYDSCVVGIDVDNNRRWDDNDRLYYQDIYGEQWSWTGTTMDYWWEIDAIMSMWVSDDNVIHNIHRYKSHMHSVFMIPLWGLVKSNGEYVNNSDVFGLHIHNFNDEGDTICVWENWNETECGPFFSESHTNVADLYFNTTTYYLPQDDGMWIENLGEESIGLWGEGSIPDPPPSINESSGHFDANISLDINISQVLPEDTSEGADVNITVNICNSGDENLTNVLLNMTWYNCSCSDWKFNLIDTNISLANITYHNDSCYMIVNIGNLTADECVYLWLTIAITECTVTHDELQICGNASSDSGIGLWATDCDTITWGLQYPPVFSNECPANGSTVTLPSIWSITIEDPNGDIFSWTIETSPDIGSNSGNGESNGSKSCSIGGIERGIRHTVFVNATDVGSGKWTRHTYWFIARHESASGTYGNGHGDGYDVEISVSGEDWRAIGGAYVEIYGEDGGLVDTGYTDGLGVYETVLDGGTYTIVVTFEGCESSRRVYTINSDGTIFVQLQDICSRCPAIFAGPYLNISVFGWIATSCLVIMGFILANIKKKYYFLIPNAILIILGLLCQPLLIAIAIVCIAFQYLMNSSL